MKNLKNAKNRVLMILHMNNAITNQHKKHLNMDVKSAMIVLWPHINARNTSKPACRECSQVFTWPCNYKALSKALLKIHTQTTHKFICEQYNFKSLSQTQLKVHSDPYYVFE